MGFVRQLTGAEAAGAATEAGRLQSEAAIRASEIQAQSQREALEETRRQFGITQEQLAPIQAIELAGLRRGEALAVPAQEQLQQLLGFGGAEAQLTAQRGILESPAQQALRDRAARLSTRTASAIGGLGGGNIRRELFEQGRGLDLAAIQQRMGQLGALAGQRFGAGAAGLGAQLGQQQAGTAAQLLSGLGGIQAGGITGAAQAQASGLLGAQQARSAGLGNILQLGGLALGGLALGGLGGIGGAAAAPSVAGMGSRIGAGAGAGLGNIGVVPFGV